MFRKACAGALCCLVVLCCNEAFALGGGGYRNEVVDAEAGGKGFSFVAQADGPSAVHYNPAGLTQMTGSAVRIGYSAEQPVNYVESAATNNSTVSMQKATFLLPNFYYVSDLSQPKLRFGIGYNTPYGLATDWARDSFASKMSEESDMLMTNLNPTVAYKVNDYISIGAGLDYFSAAFDKHRVISTSLSDTQGDFQLKGEDESFGYNIGILLSDPTYKHRFGVSYRSEIDLTYKGKACLTDLNATGQAVFSGTGYTTAIEADGTIPRSVAAGYAYKPNDKWVFEADVEWTDWSSTEEEFIRFPNETTPGVLINALNTGNPASRDWRDTFAYGLGAEYKATDKLQLRCGTMYYEAAIPSANYEPVLPDASKVAFTLGFGYLFKSVKIDAAYSYFQYLDRDITNDVGGTTIPVTNVDGKYKGYVNIFMLGFTYKY